MKKKAQRHFWNSKLHEREHFWLRFVRHKGGEQQQNINCVTDGRALTFSGKSFGNFSKIYR